MAKWIVMQPETQLLFLRGAGGDAFEALDLGKRGLRRAEEDEVSRFALLDTFDGEVAARGALLVCSGAGADLMGAAAVTGARLSQPRCRPGFVSEMPAGPVTSWLAGVVSPLRALIAVAEGEVVYRRLDLVDGREKTQVRCGLWTLHGQTGAQVTILRLEALRGYDKAFRKLVEAITQGDMAVDLGPLAASAALRGVDPAEITGAVFDLAPEERIIDTATRFLRAQLAVARRNEPGIIADHDTEFLHDYRVALRRARSVVALFHDVFDAATREELKRRLGALMAPTGALRDLDVYLIERDTYASLVSADWRRGIEKLFDRLADRREAAQAELAGWLKSPDYRQAMQECVMLLEGPGGLPPGPKAGRSALEYARPLIWKRYRKVQRVAARIDATSPDAAVHDLRIHCKKLRYAVEFFAPLFDGRDIARILKRLKTLQDTLGRFNDYAVQRQALGAFSAELRGNTRDAIEIATSLGALMAVLEIRQAEERARVAARFARFDAPETHRAFEAVCKPGGGAG
ncbi:CYTH and CHAD domain-containing protein [Pseudooceanicola sp. 502str34]